MAEPENGNEFIEYLRMKSDKDRYSMIELERYLDQKARNQGVPIMGQFELTPFCNLDCRMCYVHLTPEQMKSQSVMTVKKWKELMLQAYQMGMFRVTLSGGECLSYPGFREIYLYLHSLGCEVSILTNGVLLDEEMVHFLQEHRPVRIQITLYGNSEDAYERVTGHRVFQKVTENIQKIQEAGLPLSITTTPNRYIGDDIVDTVRLAKTLCKDVNVNPTLMEPRKETGRAGANADADIETYAEIYRMAMELEGVTPLEISEDKLPPIGGPRHTATEKGVLCAAGRSGFGIDWKGVMYPCNRFTTVKAYPLQDGFKEAWSTINHIATNWPRVSECEGCAYSSVCSACPAEMIQYVQPGFQPTQMCERTKRFVRRGVWQIPECEH